VDDREQRDGARGGWCGSLRLGLDGLELAAGRAVDGVPSAGAQPLAERVGSFEVAGPSALRALVEQLLSLGSIRSFWL
jgi:hypothetical protein